MAGGPPRRASQLRALGCHYCTHRLIDLMCAAHAFVHAPDDVRERVLGTFCGMEAVPDAERADAQPLQEAVRVARWWAD